MLFCTELRRLWNSHFALQNTTRFPGSLSTSFFKRLISATLLVLAQPALAGHVDQDIFTASDEIQTARFKVDERGRAVFVSPDRTGYVSMLIRGDVQRDGVWGEILYGTLSSNKAAKPQVIARLFTTGLGSGEGFGAISGAPALLTLRANYPVWLDQDHVGVLWQGAEGPNQIFSIDVHTRKVQQLTHESTDVVAFLPNKSGALVYDVRKRYSAEQSETRLKNGFTVRATDAMVLLGGVVDGGGGMDFDKCGRVLMPIAGDGGPRWRVPGADIFCELSFLALFEGSPGAAMFSPDGSSAIVNSGMTSLPPSWRAYVSVMGDAFREFENNPHGFRAQQLNQLLILDLTRDIARPLWDAPYFDVARQLVPKVVWSPDSRSVLVGPTLLPPSPGGSDSTVDAVAVVSAASGQYTKLPVSPADCVHIASAEWVSSELIEIQLKDGRLLAFRKVLNSWNDVDPNQVSARARVPLHDIAAVNVEERQGINQPPQLYAVEARTGATRLLWDPNPGIEQRFRLGRVEFVEWHNSDGRDWTGRLYYPARFVSGKRYPLVIQTHGYAGKDEYSLSGQGGADGAPLGPTWSVFLAQPLASLGIAVLQIGGPDAGPRPPGSATDLERIDEMVTALDTAAKHLVDMGIVDPSKVGIMGHSATGRVIEQALTDSDFSYAAAIASDYADNDYLQAALTGWDGTFAGAAPFGAGLRQWLDNSPAFNVERIRTPLQLELTDSSEGNGTLLWHWELFSRLKHLRKPVELYVVPDIKHGGHLIQNPRQLLALQDRAIDWWRYWLANYEDPDARKADQYADWHTMRAEHLADLNRPRAPRIHWIPSVAANPQ